MANYEHNKVLANELAHRTTTEVIVETSIFVAIALTALVGNSCVLYVFHQSPNIRTVTNYYIITLAIFDVALALIVMPCIIATFACGRDVIGYQAGQVICFINLSLAFGSLQTTHLIAINRYFCIVKPNIYKRIFKPKQAMLSIALQLGSL
jgi:melatonin receptor type 1B